MHIFKVGIAFCDHTNVTNSLSHFETAQFVFSSEETLN